MDMAELDGTPQTGERAAQKIHDKPSRQSTHQYVTQDQVPPKLALQEAPQTF